MTTEDKDKPAAAAVELSDDDVRQYQSWAAGFSVVYPHHSVGRHVIELGTLLLAARARVAELEGDLHGYVLGSAIEAREADNGRAGIAALEREVALLRAFVNGDRDLRMGLDGDVPYDEYARRCRAMSEAARALADHDARAAKGSGGGENG